MSAQLTSDGVMPSRLDADMLMRSIFMRSYIGLTSRLWIVGMPLHHRPSAMGHLPLGSISSSLDMLTATSFPNMSHITLKLSTFHWVGLCISQFCARSGKSHMYSPSRRVSQHAPTGNDYNAELFQRTMYPCGLRWWTRLEHNFTHFFKTFMRIVLTLMICTAVSCRFFNNFSPRLQNWFLPFLHRTSSSPSGCIAARCFRCCNPRLWTCLKHGITKPSFFIETSTSWTYQTIQETTDAWFAHWSWQRGCQI